MAQAQKVKVAIIGGGVVGCSVAYHLAKRGLKDVLVIERDLLGNGSTSKAAGGIRQQFSTASNIKISRYCVDFFTHFQERLGLAPHEENVDFHQYGYLFLYSREQDWAEARQNVALQQSLGLEEVRLLTPQQCAELCPGLQVADLIGGTYCPSDGHGNPHDVTQGFARAAKREGANFWQQTAVRSIKREGRRVVELETEQGTVQPEIVIGCAGAWSGVLGEMLGIDIPVRPLRRILFFTEAFDEMPPVVPMTIDMTSGFYFRREGPGFLIGESDEREPFGFNLAMDWNWLDTVVEHAIERVPAFERLRIKSGWAGLYDTSADENAIIGAVPELDNFYLATGFSGHGFMQSPATGLLLSDLILDGRMHSLDINPADLSIERFRQGRSNRERNII